MNCDALVSVHVLVYNHADYIRDCLDGVCIQRTSFPFVNTIIDDASTDGTREVIENYLERNFITCKGSLRKIETADYEQVLVRHRTNSNCFFAVFFLKYNHFRKKSTYPYLREWDEKAKYIALCEGDDYWIDPNKLQKQVDYLERHPDCSAAFSNIIIRDETVQPVEEHKKFYLRKNVYDLTDVFRGILFNFNCICVRKDVFDYFVSLTRLSSNGDFRLSYAAAQGGYVYKFDDFFSVYRRTGRGLSSRWSRKEQLIHSIQEWTDFQKQLGYPDRKSLAIFQTRVIISYLFGTHFHDFPYSTIKYSLLREMWYVYFLWSVYFFLKSSLTVLRRRVHV